MWGVGADFLCLPVGTPACPWVDGPEHQPYPNNSRWNQITFSTSMCIQNICHWKHHTVNKALLSFRSWNLNGHRMTSSRSSDITSIFSSENCPPIATFIQLTQASSCWMIFSGIANQNQICFLSTIYYRLDECVFQLSRRCLLLFLLCRLFCRRYNLAWILCYPCPLKTLDLLIPEVCTEDVSTLIRHIHIMIIIHISDIIYHPCQRLNSTVLNVVLYLPSPIRSLDRIGTNVYMFKILLNLSYFSN